MPNYEYEWSQPVAVERAFLELKNVAENDTEIRAILQGLWQTGSAYGYNYG